MRNIQLFGAEFEIYVNILISVFHIYKENIFELYNFSSKTYSIY